MTQPTPEWSRPIDAGTIGHEPRALSLEANEAERAGLARRFDLPRLTALTAQLTLRAQADGIVAEGRLKGELAQTCVATGDELPRRIDAPFNLKFRSAAELAEAESAEIEIDADDCDTIDYTGSHFDLGEALADTLYLALDPFPRGPHADALLKAAGVLSEGEAGPFGALSGLLKKE